MARDLIVFGEDWGGLPSSTQHLVKHLAHNRKVVWVNSIGLRQPKADLHDIKRAWQKLTSTRRSTNKITTNLALPSANFHIVHPRTLPAPRSRTARWLAAELLVTQIKPVIEAAGLHTPILWTSLPTAVDLAGRLGESALVYYCGDDFSALAGVDHDTVTRREHSLVGKADLILAASEKLCQRFPTARTRLLSHGVDHELFSQPAPRAMDLPNDGRPIAGFYGSISKWLDLELLREVALRLPDWHFVFIGKTVVDTRSLSALANVNFLGEREHHLLPQYSQHWTASLLPFVDNQQIRACYPLKLMEYLSAGRPIVSTAFPAVLPYRGLAQIAVTPQAFTEALTNTTQLHRLSRFQHTLRAQVAQQSWSARAAQLDQWLQAL